MEILPKLEAADRQFPLYALLDRIADESLDARYRHMLRVAVLHAKVLSDFAVIS